MQLHSLGANIKNNRNDTSDVLAKKTPDVQEVRYINKGTKMTPSDPAKHAEAVDANIHPVEIIESAKEYMRHKAEWKSYVSGELKSGESVMDYISRIQLVQDRLCNYFAKIVIDSLTPATGGE